jgi:hypothetical protein
VASAGRLTYPGPGLIFTANSTNQLALALFDGSVGERVSLVFTNVSMGGALQIDAPDGSLLISGGINPYSTTLDLGPLPAAGTYTVVLRPTIASGSATVRVVRDVLGNILTDGTPLPMSLAVGQNAMLSFNAVAGESYNFVLTNYASSPVFAGSAVTFLNPDGTTLKYCGGLAGEGYACLFKAPNTGTYLIRLNETGLNAASYEARLNIDFRATLVPGSPIEMQLDRIGRHALLEFSVATGQAVTINLANIVTTPSNQPVLMTVYDSNGSQIDSRAGLGTLTRNFDALPAGTYTARVAPGNAATANFLISFVAVQPTPLASNGITESFSTQLDDQNGYLTFTGSQGQNLALGITGLSFQSGASSHVSIYIAGPNGASLAAINCSTSVGRCQIPLRNLPLSGTYRVYLDPYASDQLLVFLTLSQSVIGTLTPDVPITVDFASPGQNAVLSFSVATPQTLIVKAGSMNLTPAGSSVTVRVFNAANSQVATVASSTTASVVLQSLAAGNYTVTIDPTTAGTGSLQASLTPGVPIPTDGTATNFVATSVGEPGYFTFSAVAVQNLGVGLTNYTLVPLSNAAVVVYQPNGTLVTWTYCNSNAGCALALRNLPVTGTYRIEVHPYGSQSLDFTITLSPSVTGSLTSGSPLPITLTYPGQNAVITFVATAGQSVPLTLAAPAVTPANSQVTVRVYNSSGTEISSGSTTWAPLTLTLNDLAAGTYTVLVAPNYGATGDLQLSRP